MDQNAGGAPTGASSGTPSQGLTDALSGGEEAAGGDYIPVTDATAEAGYFTLIGGYLDDDGTVHQDVHFRSMGGDEEDMLGNQSVHILERMDFILGECILRLGTITDRGKIAQAISRLPSGTRSHAIVCLRRVTHHKRHKEIYNMDVRCPIRTCAKVGSYALDLSELDVHEMPEPEKREYEVELLDSGDKITWRVATAAQERVLDVVGDEDEARTLTYSILVRLVSLNGEDVRLGFGDLLSTDKKKIKLSKKAQALFIRVRKWSMGDRGDIRNDVEDKEPNIDSDLDFICKHCHKPFKGDLDIGQRSFFFPSATSKPSKAKSST